MKKRLTALLCAALLVCQLAASPAQAVESVHFTAINDNMLPLSEENMPFWSNGYLYVDSSIFTMAPNTAGRVLGIYRSWNTAKKLLVLSSDEEVLKLMFFDLAAGTVQDNQGISYYPAAILRNNVVFVPVALIAYYFDLTYSRIRVSRGYLVRIKNDKAFFTDKDFINPATYQMESMYSEYIRNKEAQQAAETPSGTESSGGAPVVETPAGKTVYLCAEASDGLVTEELLHELDRSGSQAAFYCTPEFLAERGDLLRRMSATGQSVGLIIDGADPERPVLEQLEESNRLLWEATCGKTRLVLLKNGTDQQREELEAAGCRCLKADLDRSGTSLKSASAANQLLKRVTDRRGDVKVWLGTSADAVGLRAFLSAAKQAEDRCLALTETT